MLLLTEYFHDYCMNIKLKKRLVKLLLKFYYSIVISTWNSRANHRISLFNYKVNMKGIWNDDKLIIIRASLEKKDQIY